MAMTHAKDKPTYYNIIGKQSGRYVATAPASKVMHLSSLLGSMKGRWRMQINHHKKEELILLITGLRLIYIANLEPLRKKLAIQLETELFTHYGVMVGSDSEQERSN